MNYQPLKYIYRSSGIDGAHTLLLLHGTGGDEHDLLSLADRFGPGVNILSLRGNVSEGGMPRFFRRLGMGIFDEEDLVFRTHELMAFVKQLSEKEQFDPAKIIALGYSNGANIAGSALLLYPGVFAGAILYRPMQPFRAPSGGKTPEARPVFMSNGLHDLTIDPERARDYVALLRTYGYDTSYHELNTGHQLTMEDIDLSVDWYRQHFSHAAL